MPADPPLTAHEAAVLQALMRPGWRVENRTLEAVAAAAHLESPDARKALRSLEHRSPPLARSDVDAVLGVQFWMSTPDAADAAE